MLWVVPLTTSSTGLVAQLVPALTWIIGILVVFADYVIVYEDLTLVEALRRSLRLLKHRWPTVVLIVIAFQLLYTGIYSLYSMFYRDHANVFVLTPISQMLVEAFVGLLADLILIFLYEDIRRRSPA